MNWYYAEDGAQKGPVSEEQFQMLVQAGTIQADTLVWRDGMADWKTYGEVTSPASGTSVEPGEFSPVVAAPVASQAAEVSEPFDPEAFLQALRNKGGYSIDIGGAISRGWDVVMGNFWSAVGVNLLIMILSAIVSFIPILGSIAPLFLTGPFKGGLNNYFLRLVRDQPAALEDAFAGFVQPRFIKLMLTGLIVVLMQVALAIVMLTPVFIMIPGLLAIGSDPESVAALSPLWMFWVFVAMIPVVFLAIIWYPTYMIVVDTGLSFWQAMEFSRKIVMMRFWSWLLFLIVCAFIGMAGVMVLCVGVLVAVPVTSAAFAKVWDDIVVTARNPE